MECAPKLIKKYSKNKSYCDSKQRKFFWTINFKFYCFSDKKSKIVCDEKLKNHFKSAKQENIYDLQNFENFSYIFEDPIDDSIHSLTSLFNFLQENKNILTFNLMLNFKENFDNVESLIFLMRVNMEGNLAYFIENDEEGSIFENNGLHHNFDKNSLQSRNAKDRILSNKLISKDVYRIEDSFYEQCDKKMLLKDLLENKFIHEYPEFVIINKNILDKIF